MLRSEHKNSRLPIVFLDQGEVRGEVLQMKPESMLMQFTELRESSIVWIFSHTKDGHDWQGAATN